MKMNRAIAIDTETGLIAPGLLAPPLVCVSHANEAGAGVRHVQDPDTKVFVEEVFRTSDPIFGHNIAYDACVLMEAYPDLIPLIFQAYEESRVVDTGLIQKLVDISQGIMRIMESRAGYSLNAIGKRLLKRDRSTEKEGEDVWRLRYIELLDVALKDWPEEARKYAIDDAIETFDCGVLQVKRWEPLLADAPRQTRAALALQLMMCWGIHTDPKRVELLRSSAETAFKIVGEELKQAGLVRNDGTRNVRAVQTRMVKVCREGGFRPKLTDTGMERYEALVEIAGERKSPLELLCEVDLIKYASVDQDACKESGDELLIKYGRYIQLQGVVHTHAPDLLQGTVTPIQARYNTLVDTGRTSCSKGKGKKGKPGLLNGFQMQNPKRDLDYLPVGIRECFVAREGTYFADNDFSGLELCTVAQVCMDILGHSKLGEALNAGKDPHLMMGANLLKISYEEAQHRKHEKEVKKARQLAKCFHPDVEVLTKQGWVKISELKGTEKVAAAEVQDQGKVTIRWETPSRLTSRPSPGELVHLQTEGIDLRVTPDHRMAGWRLVADKSNVPKLRYGRRAQNHLEKKIFSPDSFFNCAAWPNAGQMQDTPDMLCVEESLLRLAVATQADGHYEGLKVRLAFVKNRKIERLQKLLKDVQCHGSWEEGVDNTGHHFFLLSRELSKEVRSLLDVDKTLPWFWLQLKASLRNAVLEEVRFWDGHKREKTTCHHFFSTKKKNVDVIQAIASISNRKTRHCVEVKSCRPGREHHNDLHVLSIKTGNKSNGGRRAGKRKEKHIAFSGEVYCLTVPSDALIVRDGGVPVVVHQCGNFGFSGGLGPEGFAAFAQGYGQKVSLEETKVLKAAWLETWPEFREYFRWIRDQLRLDSDKHLADLLSSLGEIDEETLERYTIKIPTGSIEQLRVGRFRGRCKFTVAANGMFQSLGADGAKQALWDVSRACYDPTRNSILYGARPVAFIHDEILAEVAIGQAHEQAFEMARVMVNSCNRYLPNVPVKCVPALGKYWSKELEAVFDVNKRLQPYDLAKAGKWKVFYADEQPVNWAA